MSEDQGRENRLRGLAERQGLILRKDPDAGQGHGAYQLVTGGGATTVTGDELHEYTMTLDQVEAWLTNDEATPQAEVVSEPDQARKAARGSETRTTE